jgi:hypothetical protein
MQQRKIANIKAFLGDYIVQENNKKIKISNAKRSYRLWGVKQEHRSI